MNIKIVNKCEYKKIKRKYIPLVNDVIEVYRNIYGDETILDIRIMGSVPRGESIENKSDIDFICIVNQLEEYKNSEIKNSSKKLKDMYGFFRSIDLEVFKIDDIPFSKEIILNTDSISLYGNSIYNSKNFEIDSIVLANNCTPNINKLISDYAYNINNNNDADLISYSRWIGKDILKSMRYKLIIEKLIYENSIKKIFYKLCKNYPEDKSIFYELYCCYKYPSTNVKKLNDILYIVSKVAKKYDKHS